MPQLTLFSNFTKGKQRIVLAVVLVNFLGLIFETYSLYQSYPLMVKLGQVGAIIIHSASLIFVAIDFKRYHKWIYLCCNYAILLTIVINNLAYYLYPYFTPATLTANAMQDVLYMTMYLTIAGFILSRRHIVIQGVILNLLILFYTSFLKVDFFVINGFVNIIATIGFTFILYFLVTAINKFNASLRRTVEEASRESESLQQKTKRLEKYQSALYGLSTVENTHREDLDDFYPLIAKLLGEAMGIGRVSIWSLNDEFTVMNRKVLWEKDGLEDAKNRELVQLSAKDCPIYFKSMKDKYFLSLSNVQQAKEAAELVESYLKPLNIRSMLDCTFKVKDKVAGIICCETIRKERVWSTEDVLFTQTICDFITIVHKNFQIHHLLREINVKNEWLEIQNDKNIALNTELNKLNDELKSVNENLEQMVSERTLKIQEKNQVLTEYAFINSHLLRAPIARILGLADLITREVESVKDRKLINSLAHTTNELDGVVRKISEILYDERDLSSKKVKEIISKNKL